MRAQTVRKRLRFERRRAAKANFREPPVERAARKTQRTVVRLCPIDDDGGATIATNAEWAWAGAYTPCKWRVLPAGTLADWPVAERSGSGAGRRHRVPDGSGCAPAGARRLTGRAGEAFGHEARRTREKPVASRTGVAPL